MTEEKSCQGGGIATAFAVGALAGAAIALLYAPQSGHKTRDLLDRKARELKDRAGDALDDAREMIHCKKAAIEDAVAAGKEAMENEGGSSAKSHRKSS